MVFIAMPIHSIWQLFLRYKQRNSSYVLDPYKRKSVKNRNMYEKVSIYQLLLITITSDTRPKSRVKELRVISVSEALWLPSKIVVARARQTF